MGIQVVIRSCYLGGFIGDQAVDMEWMEGKFQYWNAYMEVMSKVSLRYP